jgi:hypothetical protein
MPSDNFKRSRGRSGGASYQASPKRYAPLRAVTAEGAGIEDLECGHTIRTPKDLIGETVAARRRCLSCLIKTCAKADHPLDVERGPWRTCRCAAANDALPHLVGWHGLDADALNATVADLAAAQNLHVATPAARTHWHWTSASEWSARAGPEPPQRRRVR